MADASKVQNTAITCPGFTPPQARRYRPSSSHNDGSGKTQNHAENVVRP